MGKTIGLILLVAAIAVLVLVGLVMYVPVMEGKRSMGAATLGFGIFAAVIALPLAGAGVFFFLRGRQEAQQMAGVKDERKLLNIIKARGQIDLVDAVYELGSTRTDVQEMLYSLVGKGLYSGYINWDKGMLYSAQASQLKELKECRNCQGDLNLVGKGVIKCAYCDTEYFL